MKVKAFKRDPDKRKALVAKLLGSPRELLTTMIIMNISVNILFQNVFAALFPHHGGWLLLVGVPLFITLVFGEVIPKSICLVHNEKVSYRTAPYLDLSNRLLLPIRRVLTDVSSIVSRFLFFFLKKEKEISVDELEHALKTSRKYGVLGEDEAELVRGYLHLQESSVKELMRPREEMIFFDTEEPLSKLVHLFVDQECSRIPICQGGIDNLLGIMTSRLFFLHRASIHSTSDLIPVLQKPFYAPESISAESLLKQMYEKQEAIAIIVDEYGSLSGLIALEDLVETVIGEIVDLRDEKSRYTSAGEDVIIASGKFELAEFEKVFDVTLPSENNMVTVGGWLTEQLGDIPKSGTKFHYGDFFFHVLASDPNRVRRVYIRRLKP